MLGKLHYKNSSSRFFGTTFTTTSMLPGVECCQSPFRHSWSWEPADFPKHSEEGGRSQFCNSKGKFKGGYLPPESLYAGKHVNTVLKGLLGALLLMKVIPIFPGSSLLSFFCQYAALH